MDDLERWRDEFPILSRTVYMISNSLGAMPARAARDLADYAETWATRGVRAWEERWWEMPIEIGNKVAWIIGAPHGTVSMHENVTTAHMVALSTVRPTSARRRLVCSALDFPSMVYLFRGLEASGYELHVVPAEDDLSVSTDRMLEAIDNTTAVVAFSHVVFRTSFDHGRGRDRSARPRSGRDGHPGYVSVCRHRAAGRLRAAGGFRSGRLPEVVVRWPGQCVSVHEAGSSRDASDRPSRVGCRAARPFRSTSTPTNSETTRCA